MISRQDKTLNVDKPGLVDAVAISIFKLSYIADSLLPSNLGSIVHPEVLPDDTFMSFHSPHLPLPATTLKEERVSYLELKCGCTSTALNGATISRSGQQRTNSSTSSKGVIALSLIQPCTTTQPRASKTFVSRSRLNLVCPVCFRHRGTHNF